MINRDCVLSWLVFVSAGFASGCATVHVSGAEAQVSQGFGVLNVSVQAGEKTPTFVNTDGVGVILASQSIVIGSVSEVLASFPNAYDCRVMIIVQNNAEFDELRAVLTTNLGRVNDICLATKEGDVWPQ